MHHCWKKCPKNEKRHKNITTRSCGGFWHPNSYKVPWNRGANENDKKFYKIQKNHRRKINKKYQKMQKVRKYLEKSALPKITKKCQKKWQKRAEIFRLPLITIYKLVFCKKCEFGYIKNCGCSVSLSVCGDRVDYGAAVELLQPKIMLPPIHLQNYLKD